MRIQAQRRETIAKESSSKIDRANVLSELAAIDKQENIRMLCQPMI